MACVTLIFPPGSDPRSPYLALPALASFLRNSGVSVQFHDLDIGGIRSLMDPTSLEAAGSMLRTKARHSKAARKSARLLGLSQSLTERGPAALSVFNDPVRFFLPPDLIAARDTLLDCLDLHSAALDSKLHYSIDPVRYDIDGIDAQSLKGLLEATLDDRWNLFAKYWEENLFPILGKNNSLAIGITITNRQQVIPGLMLSRRLRQRGHFVVLGGALFTKFVAQLQRLPDFFRAFANCVVVYEGETAMLELIEALESHRDFSRVPNLLYLEGNNVRVNRTHVEDVTKLPCPDFEGLPIGSYLTPFPVLPVYFGKGCYFNRCKFCDIPYINHISQKAYRMRSPEQVAADLFELNRRFNCRHFEFTDEALPPRSMLRLASHIKGAKFNFVGYARLERTLTSQTCKELARAGVRKLFFGLESGSQQMLQHMDKGIQIRDVPRILKNCSKAGINFHLFSIVGFPEETESLARETLRFFEINAPLIDRPGNSFDVHPFGLELRTAYAREAGQLGIAIEPAALLKEFVIGPGNQWRNFRGLSRQAVDHLVAEFQHKLRIVYRDYHAGPGHLWPAFEEYAVLYADHYLDREFAFRTSIPEDGFRESFSFRWNPAIWINTETSQLCYLRSRYGVTGLTRESLSLLNQCCVTPLSDALKQLCGSSANEKTEASLIEVLNHWISEGLLQILPQMKPS
jgi:anaerobic magnesium-protoporphyrin IX monomethyl ester cyclase